MPVFVTQEQFERAVAEWGRGSGVSATSAQQFAATLAGFEARQ
jgi:hypothetical protein